MSLVYNDVPAYVAEQTGVVVHTAISAEPLEGHLAAAKADTATDEDGPTDEEVFTDLLVHLMLRGGIGRLAAIVLQGDEAAVREADDDAMQQDGDDDEDEEDDEEEVPLDEISGDEMDMDIVPKQKVTIDDKARSSFLVTL